MAGFAMQEGEALRELLATVGLSGIHIMFCTQSMLEMPLAQALEWQPSELPLPPDKLPRAMVLSGLTSEEIHLILNDYPLTKLPRPIFASVTKNNLEFKVRDLLVELLKEHRAMQQRSGE
ncbi:MAG: DUF3783 domain-containing protein [Alphaproteobacteria bacterium]